MIRVRAKSKSQTVHIITGRLTGGVKGVPNPDPAKHIEAISGVHTPFKSVKEAKEHLEKNGWEFLEVVK